MNTSENVMTAVQRSLRILVIEDDEPVARAFLRGIERAGMQAAWASTGALGLALKDSFEPHVVLVDLWLPDMNGLTLVGLLAERRDCGVVVVSGSGEEADRVVGSEVGAHDYIAKPTSMREMIARIRAVHQRVNLPKLPDQRKVSVPVPANLKVGSIYIDMGCRMAHDVYGRRLALTLAEFTALEVLVHAAGAPVSRGALSEAALRRPWCPEDRSLDQLILSLRQKLPPDEYGGRLIQSTRDYGYWLRASKGVASPQAQAALAG